MVLHTQKLKLLSYFSQTLEFPFPSLGESERIRKLENQVKEEKN